MCGVHCSTGFGAGRQGERAGEQIRELAVPWQARSVQAAGDPGPSTREKVCWGHEEAESRGNEQSQEEGVGTDSETDEVPRATPPLRQREILSSN